MTKQRIGYGASVERSTDGTNWVGIPECKSIAIPEVTQDYVEATSLDSPNGYREYVKGLKDAGEISLSAGYTSDGYQQQLADRDNPEPIKYRVTFPLEIGQTTGDVSTFEGYPNPNIEAGEVGDIIGMTITIRVTGNYSHVKGATA